jgi:glycosyltransferase involved in cell wall biosynthesis
VVARLEPEKSLDTLLEAWPRIKAATPRALLVIAGDGSQRAALTNKAASLPDVRFLGLVRDPVSYLQAADCYTLPSLTEGLPISLLEAMAAGIPCVVASTGGSLEALAGLGQVVPPGDEARLASTIVRVLQFDPAERERTGAATRQRVVEHYSLEANADVLCQLYGRLARR